MTRYIFITGGVVSSLGKGIAASSLAAILEARGLKVTLTKLDPYINVDPGARSSMVKSSSRMMVPKPISILGITSGLSGPPWAR